MEEEKRHIPDENIYNSRGCCKKITIGDSSRIQQTYSCAKLPVFDWTKDYPSTTVSSDFNIVEVRFKNSRKEFFKIASNDQEAYETGDIVAVEASPGHDIGMISLQGELVKLQLKKKGLTPESETIRKIFRKARQNDIDKWNEAIAAENNMQKRAREIAAELGLLMKINDVEIQGDFTKATFYFTADDRIDFRQLIKQYAAEFNVRIEMRQIGVRQEAGHLGGIGTCGRELCCATCLTTFNSVVTQAARIQQISINPHKLAGQCGKLKCCLNYEYDVYVDAMTHFPDTEQKIITKKGNAVCVKIDVFEKRLFYAYENALHKFFEIPLNAAKKIIEQSKNNQPVTALEDFSVQKENANQENQFDFENVVGQDDLTRFDKKKKNKDFHQKHHQKNKNTANNNPNNNRNNNNNNNNNKKKN